MSKAMEFNSIVFNSGYSFVNGSKYTKAREYVKLKHEKCGFEWKVRADHFKRGSGCPNCSKNKQLNTSIIAKKISEFTNNEYSLVGEYINAKTKIKIRHENESCGYYEYEVIPYSFFRGESYCHRCSERERLDTDKFKDRVYKLVKNEYTVLGEYKNSDEPILMQHNNEACNYFKWKVRPYNFIGKESTRCPSCFGSPRYSTEEYKQLVYELEAEEYSVLGEYVNAHTYIKMGHNSKDCDFHEWDIVPNSFLSGRRCPKCAVISRGEKEIRLHLDKCNVEYQEQVTFDDCRTKRPLPFDFGIYNQGKLLFLIEYQGIQHYEPNDYYGGEKEFKIRQRNDNIKREYCKKNNIPLLEIPYYEFKNIKSILDCKLKTSKEPV